MTDDSKNILFCPHCGNTSVQTILVTQSCVEHSYWGPEAKEEEHDAIFTVTRCETCTHVLVYEDCEDFTDQTPLGNLIYPKQSVLVDAVPFRVRCIYLEASRVKKASPTAFVILARRLLEEICRDKGIIEPTLSQSLSKLTKQGVIPAPLSEASNLIRLVGNSGAHASDLAITVPQVWAIDDFIKAIVEYLYVAPERIERFKKSQRDFESKNES